MAVLVFFPAFSALADRGGEGWDRGGGGADRTGGVQSNQGGGGKVNPGSSSGVVKPRSRANKQGVGKGNSSGRRFNSSRNVNRNQTFNHQSSSAQVGQNQTVHHFGGANKNTSAAFHSNPAGNPGRHSYAVSPQAQSRGVNRVTKAFTNSHQLMPTDRTRLAVPQPASGPQGSAIHASVISRTAMNGAVVRSQMAVVGRPQVTAQINIYNRSEVVPNHYYWHTYNGWNYCHYYDPYGYHWYGWYMGSSCFWSRYWAGNWWWWDPVYYHWCYWNDGWWWWQDPANVSVVYVYDNGSYVNAASVGETPSASAPSESPSGVGMEATSPSASSDSTASNMTTKPLPPVSVDKVLNSKDGTRQVKIVGGDAFLYDKVAADNDSKPVFLSDNVQDVKFVPGTAGAAPRVLVTLTDGTVQTYDSDGNLVQDKGQS